jgi:hypothetical protein
MGACKQFDAADRGDTGRVFFWDRLAGFLVCARWKNCLCACIAPAYADLKNAEFIGALQFDCCAGFSFKEIGFVFPM